MENKFWTWMENHEAIGEIVSWIIIFSAHPIRTVRFWVLACKESYKFGMEMGKYYDSWDEIPEWRLETRNDLVKLLFTKIFEGTDVVKML